MGNIASHVDLTSEAPLTATVFDPRLASGNSGFEMGCATVSGEISPANSLGP